MARDRLSYTPLEELHVGGMARLRRAVLHDGRQVVVRELLARNVANLRLHRSFVTGTRIRKELSPHERIVGSLERGHRGWTPYEIIEYVEGVSLRRLMQQRAEVIEARPFELLRQAAEGLAHVHQEGYVHFDVKEENFIVRLTDSSIRVKLTDFDLTCHRSNCRKRYRSGTPAYMAPEQIKRQTVGPTADIFAFGIMAYHLVTGRMPFAGKHERQRQWKQTSERYNLKNPRALTPDLSPRLDCIIMRCLEKRPENRFPSMSYLCKELAEI